MKTTILQGKNLLLPLNKYDFSTPKEALQAIKRWITMGRTDLVNEYLASLDEETEDIDHTPKDKQKTIGSLLQ